MKYETTFKATIHKSAIRQFQAHIAYDTSDTLVNDSAHAG